MLTLHRNDAKTTFARHQRVTQGRSRRTCFQNALLGDQAEPWTELLAISFGAPGGGQKVAVARVRASFSRNDA